MFWLYSEHLYEEKSSSRPVWGYSPIIQCKTWDPHRSSRGGSNPCELEKTWGFPPEPLDIIYIYLYIYTYPLNSMGFEWLWYVSYSQLHSKVFCKGRSEKKTHIVCEVLENDTLEIIRDLQLGNQRGHVFNKLVHHCNVDQCQHPWISTNDISYEYVLRINMYVIPSHTGRFKNDIPLIICKWECASMCLNNYLLQRIFCGMI